MSESYRALCSDHYVNQKLNLKLDLPRDRQTTLDLFDRVRREFPSMDQVRRYRDELALESRSEGSTHQWLAIRSNNIRSGSVNPAAFEDAYRFHGYIAEASPYFLSISPLDVDYIELLFGFDLLASGNHNEIVYQALIAESPLGRLLDLPGAVPIDCQPVFGAAIRDGDNFEVCFEVKTRVGARGRAPDAHAEPISVYLTLRKYGPVRGLKDLPEILQTMADRGEDLVDSRVMPCLIAPLRQVIGPGS